jgi:filamentous hemagglutinin family protein
MKVPPYLLALFVLMGLFASAKKAQTQTYQPSNRVPIADSTLGTTVIRNADNFAITGGLSRGQNTFHSFQDFSVPTNGAATFANPVGNQSIITRVTGNLFSDINGTINTQGANFLLINPNGVVFGPGTQLNVGRVFAASTANGVDLVDGAGRTLSFGTNTSGDGALLSIDPKVIFNVSRLNLGGGTGEINNFGTLETNNQGQYIGLVGGNINVNGGRILSRRGGRVELGGLSAVGFVGVGIEDTNLRLSFPAGVDRANVSIINKSNINTAGIGGADINISAKNIEVLGGSIVASGTASGMIAAGNVVINATENVRIGGNNSFVANVGLSGKGGNVLINTGSLVVEDGAIVGTNTSGKGDAGNVTIFSRGQTSVSSNAGINSTVSNGAEGNGGNITIDAESFSAQNSFLVGTLTDSKGNSGDITIRTKNATILSDSSVSSSVSATGIGKSGNIFIDAGDLMLDNGRVLTFTSGQGNAGSITLSARNTITAVQGTTKSIISSDVNVGAVGKGGDINLNAGKISLTNALLDNRTTGKGDAGNIELIAKNEVFIDGRTVLASGVDAGGVGNGGNINVKANILSINNSSFLTSAEGIGNAGNVSILADGNVSFANTRIFSDVGRGGVGQGGNISINGGTLSFTNKSSLFTSTQAQGGAGTITIASPGIVSLIEGSDLITSVDKTGVGKGGDININAGSLLINDGHILTSTTGQGNAGNTNIVAEDAISLTSRSLISNIVSTGGVGRSGDINIKARSLLGDTSRISSSSFGQGDAGNIAFAIKDAISFSNFAVFSDVSIGGVGNGGNVDVTADSLSFTKASQIISSVRAASATEPAGRGNAGNITVKIAGLANFDTSVDRVGSGLFTSTEAGTEGNGGNINVQASNISLKDGSGFRSTIAGKGNSGNVTVTATDKVSFNGVAGVLSRVEATGIGNAGDINVSGSDISFRNGAGLTAETLGQGNAGNITVDASNSIFLSGEGNNTRVVFLLDRGGILARSQSVTGIAGDITVTAPKITLDNGGLISSQSNFGGGGNITIGGKNATDLFFLRRGSQVATDAGVTAQQGGDGGNININANFIFAVPKENSDISANAAQGRGGNVTVNSQGLFGIQQRLQPSSNSDITASSSFGQNGIVNINTPGIDPGKDTSDLPSTPTDASRQITQTCNSSQVGNRFYVTGRGGHPATSEDSFTQEVVWLDSRNPRTSSAIVKISTTPTQSPQPAVGWAFNGQGKVTLLATNSTGEIKRASVICPNSSR